MTTGCIEYWLMLHYDMYAPSIQTVAEKQRVMDRLLAKEPNYRKGDAAVTAKIAQNYPTAVINARQTVSNLRQHGLPGLEDTDERNRWLCQNCYNYDYDGYVFVNELGERMRPNYLTEYFPKYIAKHGMPKMRFHDLRHSCASLLLANGVPLKQIQEWLGHSDFSTTANIYAHLDYRSKISSAQAMEQGMLLPRSDDFGSRWEDVTEQGKIAEPDLNPVFD